MIVRFIILAAVLFFASLSPVNAGTSCDVGGVTVIYVNGILTSKTDADIDKQAISDNFTARTGRTDVIFHTGYNPSHLGGLGDLLQSISQAYGNPVSGFDLNTILNQLHDEVHTQKILLVGHSQGAFYVNALYDYLTTHGIPKSAIAVYHTGSPASAVSGDGRYMTSATDTVINAVRDYSGIGKAQQPLPANVKIKLTPEEEESTWGGHSLSDVYLNRGGVSIAGSMHSALNNLQSGAVPKNVQDVGGCFVPPGYSVAYRAQQAALAVADPIGSGLRTVVGGTIHGVNAAQQYAWDTAAKNVPFLKLVSSFDTDFDNPQELATAFGGVRDIYGSTATEEVINELLGIQTNEDEPAIIFLDGSNGVLSYESAPQQGVSVVNAQTQALAPQQQVFKQQQNEPAPTPAPIPQQQTQPIQTPGGIQPLTFGGGGVGGGGGSTSSATTTETTEESNPEPEPEPEPAPEPIDTTPPELTLTIVECAHSVSNSACVLTVASDLTINWEAVADDLDYVTYQGVETTNTTATDAIVANESKTFTVQAFDTAGNSTTKSITVYTNTMPVVINEVAWSGTKASALDEWIELYNNSPYAITLDGWRVVVANGAFEIPLAGIVPSDAYFLIKKKQETDTNEETSSAILNVTADVWEPWDGGLSDRGVVLALTDSTDTVVDEVTLCASNRWCAGATGGSSMERIRASEVNDTANWSTADSTILFALDRSVSSMRGTPRARNIATGMLPATIATDITLTAAGSPYFVSGTSIIQPGTTLTMHEGAVIKFMNSASQLVVKGALVSEGSAENPAVFTALADDMYGGDSNYNDDSTTPNPGAWHSIQIENGGVATLSNTLVRYGGRRSSGQSHHGAFDVQNGGTLTADALVIEYAQEEALYIREGAMVAVQDSVFQHNEDVSFGYGIYAMLGKNDALRIANSTFTNNAQAGLYAGGLGAYTITNNTFTQNGTALFVQNFLGDVLNNSGNDNTINGITLPATLGIVGTPQTLPANSLPYRITTTITIPTGAEVAFGEGVRVELSVGGSNQLLVDGGTLTLENGATLTSAFAAPTPGAWGSVVIKNGGTLRGSGATIEYAGGNSFYGEGGAGVYITDAGSTLTLTGSTVQHNKNSGVYVADGTVDISNTTIAHHTDGVGIDVRGGAVTLTNITFDDNIQNTNPTDLIP